MKILLVGNYGAGNYGDEIILSALLQMFTEQFPKAFFYITSANPEATVSFNPSLFEFYGVRVRFVPFLPFGIRSFSKAIFRNTYKRTVEAYRDCDAVILGGGGLFADDESALAPFLWGLHASFAKFMGKPLYSYGIGVGPLKRPLSRWALKKGLGHAVALGVRDTQSRETLKKIALRESAISPDPVFLLEEFSGIAGLSSRNIPKKPYVIVSLRKWKTGEKMYKKIAQALDYIVEKYDYGILFVPFQLKPSDDGFVMDSVSKLCKRTDYHFRAEYPTDLQSLLSMFIGAKACIGMRFHSVLLSILTKIPCLSIIYSEKTESLLETHLPFLSPFVVRLEEFYSPGTNEIFKKIDALFGANERLLSDISKTVPYMQEQAKKSFFSFVQQVKMGNLKNNLTEKPL